MIILPRTDKDGSQAAAGKSWFFLMKARSRNDPSARQSVNLVCVNRNVEMGSLLGCCSERWLQPRFLSSLLRRNP